MFYINGTKEAVPLVRAVGSHPFEVATEGARTVMFKGGGLCKEVTMNAGLVWRRTIEIRRESMHINLCVSYRPPATLLQGQDRVGQTRQRHLAAAS